MEYIPGDPILIKNIVTKFKSQGIFDQIRKECIADVDTKPAYQNLCHRADNQVSKFLSKVKWGPDLHKNQTRENIRRQINECSFVEPGIAIIVDQLVNPRINTEIVPKVEDMLYKFLGIPMENISSQRETKYDRNSSKDVSDCEVPGISSREIYDKRKDTEKSYTDRYEEHYRMDSQKNNGISTSKNDSSTNKTQSSGDKYSRDKSSSTKIDPFDALLRDSNKSIKTEPEKHYPGTEFNTSPFSEFDSESSDDEMSPPFEPHVKSDNDMSIGSGDSNFSEIIDTRPPNEPEIPGVDDQIDDLCKMDDSKIITEHEDSVDSVQSTYSTAPEPEPEPLSVPAPVSVSEPEPKLEPQLEPEPVPAPVPAPVSEPEPEKVHISPIEIPKTPTINYETSDDSDDYVKNKKLLDNVAADTVEPLEVPEVNFDKIVEKVIEDNTDSKVLEMVEIKPPKEEDRYKDKNRLDDTKKKTPTKHKNDKSVKPVENKEKHLEKKSDHRNDKDRKYDKHRSEGRSKDREKEKPKQDSSKSHSRKDDKSHHSRDHSKSDYDRKSKSEHRKDDSKKDDKKDSGRSDYKKDDRGDHKKDDKSDHRKDPRGDRKKEDDKKHSRDDKDRKKDAHKSSSSDDKKSSKPRVEESKHKYADKPRDDKKSSKDGDHYKSKKKSEDPKKSRSHCNLDEKKKPDRRSSDRDSSGPSTSNSSSVHHTSSQHSSRSDKDKGSSKHRHSSSSSSSHKTKRNDSEHDKNRSEKQPNDQEKNNLAEDDLEMILESSPDKGFQNNMKPDVNFASRKILANQSNLSNDHIEDMMNEMFEPTKPVLKKPKIAKNFADIRRIMKLRKLYEEDFKLKECLEQNPNESITDADKSTMNKFKLRKTVDYFVMRRFGKNGNNLEKCKELTNAIIETLTDVKLNITRVDRRYSLVDGSCTLSNDENCFTFANNVDDENNTIDTITDDNEDIENMSIIEDERANLILEDLANSYTDPNFKLGIIPPLADDPSVAKLPQPEEETLKIVQSEIKANGAKTRLPVKLTPTENDEKSKLIDEPSTKIKPEEDDSSPGLKLKIKSISDGKNITWQACDQVEQIQDPVRYLPLPEYNSGFMQYVNGLLNEEYDFEVPNLSIEMDYPECYDFMFANFLGAKVIRPKPDDAKTGPIKYNSQIINKKLGDKSIMLRIKKFSESEESPSTAIIDQKILSRKRKLADDSGVELDILEIGKDEAPPVKKRKKTLGIKRSFVNPLKMKLISGQLNDTPGNDNLIENVTIKAINKSSPIPKKTAKLKKVKEMAAANANHKKSESESSDGRRSSVSSSGTSSTHSKGINELVAVPPPSPAPATGPSKSKKNIALNDSKTDTIETNAIEGPTTTKTTDPPPSKKPIDTKSAEEKRKLIIMKSYYDESDLYKPRPSLRLTSRRYRLGNAENT